MRFATSALEAPERSDAFAAPVWLWRDPDRPECGKLAVETVEAARAALYWPALASDRHERDGAVRPEWLAAFAALHHAQGSKAPGTIEAARRLFRKFAERSGALVKAYAVGPQNLDAPDSQGQPTSLIPIRNAFSTRTEREAMTTSHRVRINGEEFWASREEVLLDAALRNGIDIPHDCRSGQCGKCRVRTVKGGLFTGGATGASEEAHACQSRIIGDVTIAVDTLPEHLATSGQVAAIRDVAPDVVEVLVVPSRPLTILPGQYLNVAFNGFPARAFCPTVCLEDPGRAAAVHFHIRRLAGGRVSAALGREIGVGHAVKLTGPFGAAHLQPGLAGRLVLVGQDTGFAPLWSIAAVALQEQPERRIDLVVGSLGEHFYMEPALRWLARFPNVAVTRVAPASQAGDPADHLPDLGPDDVVYVAGAPATVHAAMAHASAAGAVCLAEAFGPSDHLAEQPSESLLGGWRFGRREWSAKPQPGDRAASGAGRERAVRAGRGIDFYLRGVAAAGAIVACSGIVLGALLPIDDTSGSSGQATAQAPAVGDQISPGIDVPDLPIQVAVQLERDRQWAEDQPPSAAGEGAMNADGAKVVAGVWAPDVSACSNRQNRKRLIPAVITADGASAGDTFCAFKRKRQTETGMDVVANCSNPSSQWTTNVRLSVSGNRLVWSSARGTQAYIRCEPDFRMAQAR